MIILPIVNAQSECIGRMESFSSSVIANSLFVELIRSWRQEYRQFFFTQFDETTERARNYVQSVIEDPTRLMFFIYAQNDSVPVGHLGVMHLDRPIVELDNMIRGREGGDKRLMYWAEIALLKWVFDTYGDVKVRCNLLDDNWKTIRHHSRVGFKMVATCPLTRWEANGEVHLQPYTDGMVKGELIATSLGQMELTAEEFLSIPRGESCT